MLDGRVILSEAYWLVLAIPLGLAVLLAHRYGLIDAPPQSRLRTLMLRLAFVIAVTLALARPGWEQPTHEAYVIVAVDVSKSIGEQGRRAIADFVSKLPESSRLRLIPFAGRAGVPMTSTRAWVVTDSQRSALDESATNLPAVFDAAATAVPPGYVRRVVLLSDGRNTEGAVGNALAGRDLEVWTVPLPPPEEPDVQVVRIEAPPRIREGESFVPVVVIASTVDTRGTISFSVNEDARGDRKEMEIKAGENRFTMPRVQAGGEKQIRLFAKVNPTERNRLLENDSAKALVLSAGKSPVLIVAEDPMRVADLKRVLEADAFLVTVLPTKLLPDHVAAFHHYDLVILANVSLTQPVVPVKCLQALRQYVVELGGGLIVAGGPESYGPGGYAKSPLEEVLPVHLGLVDKNEQQPHAMVLVIDKSGSMQGEPIQMARLAAQQTLQSLRKRDIFGAIVFDSAHHWAATPAPAANQSDALNGIESINATGGTRALPALNDALKGLQPFRGTCGTRHIIFLTDGDDNEARPPDFFAFAERAASEGVTLSTVALGAEANAELLREIAVKGRGKAYVAATAAALPQIFVQEALRSSQTSTRSGAFRPRRASFIRGRFDDIDWAAAPPLHGYNVARTRVEAEELLVIHETLDPLLAIRNAGLGHSAAFLSTADSAWAAAWLANWGEGYDKFWRQLAREVQRPPDPPGFELKIIPQGRTAKLILDAIQITPGLPDTPFLNGANVTVTVNQGEPIPMPAVAPGRYEIEAPTPHEGDYIFSVRVNLADGAKSLTRSIVVGYPDELTIGPTDEVLLRDLASRTGGVFQPEAGRVLDDSERTAPRRTPLWRGCLGAAILLWLLDIASRRLSRAGTVSVP